MSSPEAVLLRIYNPNALAADGYPTAWHLPSFSDGERMPPIKDLVREIAGHRCERCGHPYLVGQSDPRWSRCDAECSHDGPWRMAAPDGVLSTQVPETDADSAALLAAGWRIEAAWRVLTVHHLNGVKYDCRWWNLAALCQRCHLSIQGRVRMEQVYPHEHTAWFKPHAAGYYASVYLNEDLTREETLERLDDLLALERLA